MKKNLSNAKPARTRSVNFRGGVRGITDATVHHA
jgi:hypothetical protein